MRAKDAQAGRRRAGQKIKLMCLFYQAQTQTILLTSSFTFLSDTSSFIPFHFCHSKQKKKGKENGQKQKNTCKVAKFCCLVFKFDFNVEFEFYSKKTWKESMNECS